MLPRKDHDDLWESGRQTRRFRLRTLSRRAGVLVEWLLLPLRWTAYTVWRFFRKWTTSRNLASLLWGTPAILAAAILVTVGFLASGVPKSELVARYQRPATRAEQRGAPEAAALWLEKSVVLEPHAPEHQFRLALAAQEQGRLDQAREIMNRIAPGDRLGYPEAHFRIARDLFSGQATGSGDLPRVVEHHLTASLRSPRAAPQAHSALGELLLRQKRIDDAIPHLEKAAEHRPELGVTLGQVYLLQGEASQASAQLKRASEHFAQVATEDENNLEATLMWARCELLQGKLAQAERILQDACARSDDPRLPTALSRLYLLQFDRLRQQEPADLERALVLLEAAANYAPNDRGLLSRLSGLAESSESVQDEVVMLLKQVIVNGKPTATAHLVLGTILAKQGDSEGAATHFLLGLELRPQMVQLMNNLAWTPAHADSPDLERALQLANAALQAAPDHPEILETRGQIFAKLQRWTECIVDLEKARPAMPERSRVHATLALAYEKIGGQELAEKHRRLADELNTTDEQQN
jgi:tetratricopeptide (TPR) repeat protein